MHGWAALAIVSLVSRGNSRVMPLRGERIHPLNQSAAAERLPADVIYRKSVNSLVTISIKDSKGYRFKGVGFFAYDDSHIATSYHVLEGATEMQVEGVNGTTWKIAQVKFNKKTDLAILRLDHPTGVKPLPFSNFSEVLPGDAVVVVSNADGRTDTHPSTGLVSRVVRQDGQTLLAFSAPVPSGCLGSPVIDSHGRVLAVARTPIVSIQDAYIGANVLGLNYLPITVPLDAFLTGTRTNAPKAEIGEVGLTPKSKLRQGFATWIDSIGLAELEWRTVYLKLASGPLPRDTNVLEEPSKVFIGAVNGGMDKVIQLGLSEEGFKPSNIEDLAKKLVRSAVELTISEKTCIVDGQHEDLARAAGSVQKADAAFQKLKKDQASLVQALSDLKWFSWKDVKFLFHPAVWAEQVMVNQFDALPDPDRTDGAAIGATFPTSDFREGDVIDAIADDIKDPFVAVHDWKEVADFVEKHPTPKKFYVRVRRGGAHSSFFSLSH